MNLVSWLQKRTIVFSVLACVVQEGTKKGVEKDAEAYGHSQHHLLDRHQSKANAKPNEPAGTQSRHIKLIRTFIELLLTYIKYIKCIEKRGFIKRISLEKLQSFISTYPKL